MSSGVTRRVWLDLGGNIGDVREAMSSALKALDVEPDVAVSRVSPLYKTPPWGVTEQADFLNCCAEILTDLEPEMVLELCQAVEKAGKRKRLQRWGPRTIDVDILIVEGIEQTEQRLTIPHPRMGERAFVLVPLSDIAPELVFNGSTIGELAAVSDKAGLEILNENGDWWLKSG